MPIYSVQGPDGRIYDVEGPAGASEAQIIAVIRQQLLTAPAATTGQPESGFIPGLKSGVSGLKSGLAALAGRTGLMDMGAAKQYMREQDEYQQRTYKDPGSFSEAPVTKTLGLLGQSAPYMLAPLAAAAMAPAAAVPLGVAGLTVGAPTLAALATGAVQHAGSGLGRQVQEGTQLEDTNLAAASAVAVPAAILDRVSFGMIPGIRQIFKQAGKEITPVVAKRIAEQGVKEVAKDYAAATGKAMGAEGVTETAQQVLERLQAGLNLSDKDARDEYFDSFVGGAVLGGVISPAGRYVERRGVQKKEEAKDIQDAMVQREVDEKAAHAAAEQRKTPEGQLAFAQDYEARQARWQELKALPKPGKDATPETQAAYAEVKKELSELQKGLYKDASEYRAAKAGEAQQQQAARAADEQRMSQMEVQASAQQPAQAAPFYHEPQQSLPGVDPVEQAPAPAEPDDTDYAAQVRNLTDSIDELREQAQQTTSLAQKQELARLAAPLQEALVKAQAARDAQAAEVLQPEKDAQKKIKALLKGMEKAESDGDLVEQSRIARELSALGFDDTAGALAAVTPPEQGAFPMRKFTSKVEPKDTFAARVYKPGPLDIESQEQEALDEAERQRQADADKAARDRALAPEQLALRRIAANNKTQPALASQFYDALSQQNPAEPGPGGSSAMGRTAQDLQGKPVGAQGELIYTAEDGQPAPQPQPRRVDNTNNLTLFNERGARPLDRAEIEARLARLLANPKLSDDAYNLLRRIERVLPQADYAETQDRAATTTLGKSDEEVRKEREAFEAKYPGSKFVDQRRIATVRNTARTEGLLTLVDKQLSRIEQGLEGVAQRGKPRVIDLKRFPARGAANTAAPTVGVKTDIERRASASPGSDAKRIQVLQPESNARDDSAVMAPAEKRRADNQPTTLRGPSSKAAPLSDTAEIEPLLRNMERTADENAGQMPLFAADDRKLGFIKPDAAAFARLRNSPYVRGLRKALNSTFDKLARANRELPKLRADIAQLQKRLDKLHKAHAAHQTAEQLIRQPRDIAAIERPLAALNARMTDLVVERMQLQDLRDKVETDREQAAREMERLAGVEPGLLQQTRLAEDAAAQLEQIDGVLGDVQAQFDTTQGALNTLQAQVQALRARNEIAELRQEAMFASDKIAETKAELRAKHSQAGDIERDARAAYLAEKEQEAAQRRERAATQATAGDSQRAEEFKARQARLDAMFGDAATGLQYPAISEAQRQTREMGEPTIPANEQTEIDKDPRKVLGGYRSKAREIEKRLQNAQAKSTEARGRQLDGLRQRRDDLFAQYKATQDTATRDAIGAQYDAAERTLTNAARKLSVEPLTWVGMKRDIAQLADVLNRIDDLEYKLNEGLVSAPEDRVPKLYIRKDSLGEKAARLERENRAAAAEGATRADAPSTSGDAVTRTQAAKLTKQQKTLYSSKGGGAEVQEKLAEQVAAKAAVDHANASDPAQRESRAQLRAAVEDKQAKGKPLNPFEEAILTYGGGLYRVSDSNGKGMATADVQKVADAVVAGWEKVPPIEVVAHEDALPQRVIEQMRADKVQGRVPGLYDPQTGKVYLIARNLHSPNDVALTVAHEVAGHFGLREMMGDTYAANMGRIYEGNEAVRTQADAKMRTSPSLTRDVAVEEVLADMAEQGPNANAQAMNALRRIFYAIKSWLANKLGIKNVSDAEVRQIVANARRFVKTGKGGARAASGVNDSQALYRTAPSYANDEMRGIGADTQKYVARQRTWADKLKANFTGMAFATQLVDRFAGFERLAKYMPSLHGTQMLYYMRMYDQRMNFVSQAVSNGVPQRVEKTRADGRKEWVIESVKGANIKNVVDKLREAQPFVGNAQAVNELFTAYLSALRADRVGLAALNFGKDVTQEMLNKAKRAVESNPQLRKVFDDARAEYNAYNKDLMQMLADSGALPAHIAKELGDKNDYIPFYRQQGGNAVLLIGGETPIKIGSLADQPHLHELVGGDEAIFDFMTASVQNTNLLVDMALRNTATKNAVFELMDLGAARIVKGTPSGPDIVQFKIDGKDTYAVIETETVTIAGKRFDTGVPADLLVKGMSGIPTQLTGLMNFAAMPSKVLRKAVTLSPMYMAKQLFRDSVSAPIVSGANFTPVWGALRTINSATKGVLERRGIVGGQQFHGTSEDMSKILRDVADGKPGWASALSKAEALGMEADALTRRAQYNSYIKQGLSEMEATLMALESMNFNKRGASPSVHTANSLIPFLNAQIQGLNVLFKAATGNMPFNDKLKIRQKMLERGAYIAVASMVYAALNEDEEDYKNATPDQKYGNWFVSVPGTKERLRLPVPFEVGYIFKAVPEALYNSMTSEHGGEEAVKAFRRILLSTLPGGSSYFIPQIIKPAFETGADYSTYTGRGILSAQEKGLLPEEQYRANTAEVSKLAGKAFGLSPTLMENLVRGYTGTLGIAFLHALSLGAPKSESPETATKRLSEYPIVGGAFQPADAGGIINSVYERFNQDIAVRDTYKKMLKEGRAADAQSLLDRRGNEIMEAEMGDAFKTNMNKLTQAERAVAASSMTPAEKRKQLDELRKIKTAIATAMREAADKTTRQ